MDVATLWIVRRDSDIPELLEAWDRWSIEENWDGWETACSAALEKVGADLRAFRFVNLRISDAAIAEQFREWQTVPVESVSQLDDPRSL